MASGEVHKQENSAKNEAMFSEEDMKSIFKNESILSNKNESLEKKIIALITTWGELSSLQTCPTQDNLKTLSEFVKSHTLNIVLSANWLRYKEKYYAKLVSAIIKCHNVFDNYRGFQLLCYKLVTITESPWKKKTIIRMLNNDNPTIGIDEYNFFVHEESGYFISMRLKKLCDEGCEDMALNLTRAYIRCCEWAESVNRSMYITVDQKKFVFDVYFALLYKFDHTGEMSRLFKNTTLPEGIDMVRRFAFKDIAVSNIWVNSIKIAQLAGTIFLTKGVMLPLEESRSYLIELLDIWLPTFDLDLDREELISYMRRIMKNAISAPHMFFFSKHLTLKYGFMLRNYNVEVYIQALNTDLNLLEKLKTEDNDSVRVEELSVRIANGLLDLANLLKENLDVSKECVLSSFSLKPTEVCLKKIEELARASGHNVLDTGQWKCKFHPPPSPEDELLISCKKCGEFMAELQVDAKLKAPNIPLGEALRTNCMGLTEQLRDDLVVIIFCARYQLLSWLQNWSDLHRLCIMYLDDPVGTKNLITELKFLDIDYTPFLLKREVETIDHYDNHIEQVITEGYSESKRKKKRKRVLSSSDEDYDNDKDQIYLPSNQRSDPEVLKTLRSFRRSLKRDPEVELESMSAKPPSWYAVYDYSATNTESSQSSSSAYSPRSNNPYEARIPIPLPIPLPLQTPIHLPLQLPLRMPPHQGGIQIRKDIYQDPREQLTALQFFREENINMELYSGEKGLNLQSNFSKPPVIQESPKEPSPSNVTEGTMVEGSDIKKPRSAISEVLNNTCLGNGVDKIKHLEDKVQVKPANSKDAEKLLSNISAHLLEKFEIEHLEKQMFGESLFCNNNNQIKNVRIPIADKDDSKSSDNPKASESTLDCELVNDINVSNTIKDSEDPKDTCINEKSEVCKDIISARDNVDTSTENRQLCEDDSKLSEGNKVSDIPTETIQVTKICNISNENSSDGSNKTLNGAKACNITCNSDIINSDQSNVSDICVISHNEETICDDGNETCQIVDNVENCHITVRDDKICDFIGNDKDKISVEILPVVDQISDLTLDLINSNSEVKVNGLSLKLTDSDCKVIAHVPIDNTTSELLKACNVKSGIMELGLNEESRKSSKHESNKDSTKSSNHEHNEDSRNCYEVIEDETMNSNNSSLHETKSTDISTDDKVFVVEEKNNIVCEVVKDVTPPIKIVNLDVGNIISININEKFCLKECRVILNRVMDLRTIKRMGKRCKKRKPGRPKLQKDNSSVALENKVFLERLKNSDENYNMSLNTPLQTKNNRITLIKNKNDSSLEDLKRKLLVSSDKMNPRVVLKRLDDSCIKSLLAGVPGILDTNLFRPENTDQIVNVVQVAGGRTTSTVQSPNTQTSTQVSPHIQRIGQPRNEKTEQTSASEASSATTKSSANTYTISKPVSTQSPTLINILSQQIIRPSNSSNTRTRTAPLINILGQQTIRPANTSATAKTTTTVTSDTQGNNTSRIIATSSEQQQILNQIVNPNRTSGSLKTVVGTSNSEQGRIVQFICKSTDGKLIPVTSFPSNRLVKVGTTQAAPDSPSSEENFTKLVTSKKTENELSEALPKFQQAFGKSVYQNNVDSSNTTNVTNNANSDIDKTKMQIKNTSVSVQPIQGSVIYTRQMPVGQTINLIPQTRGQVFRIATTNAEQISLVKDTVIHSKMSALLAAALQGKPKNSEVINDLENSTDSTTSTTTTTTTRVQLTRPTLVQNARIVKPVIQIPSNVIRNTPQTNLSSTTLEQLREFDMVYKQVKERSSTSTPSETTAISESSDTSPQRISVTYLNQGQKINCAPVVVVSSYNSLQPAASPALSVASQGSSSPCVTPAPTPTPVLPKVAAKSSKGKSVKNAPMHASKTSPIPKPQQKPQEDEHTTQRIFDILAEYAEQLRNSPDLNNKPAPRRRSNPPTNPSQNSKRKKSSSSKKSGQCSSLSTDADVDDPRTVGSEDSSCGVVQLSMQDDEQTPTAASTSESNDSTVTTRQQLILTDSTHNQTRNLIIADSSVGEALKMPNTAVLVPGNYIMPVSMVKGGQQIAVVSGGSKILATVPARSGPNMLLFQSFLNQNRKTNVPTVKYSTIQPISGISSQSLTGVTAQPPVILPPPSHGISTVTLGQPIAIKKIDETDRVNTELLLTISQSRENSCTTAEDTRQPDSSTSVVPKIEHVDLDENTAMSDNSSEKTYSYQKPIITAPIATPVIAQTIKEELSDEQSDSTTTQTIMTLNINPLASKGDNVKVEERVQSVLVSAGSSNGPMLSHSPPQYKQSDCGTNNEPTKDDYLRNGGKRIEKVQQSTVFCMQGKSKKVTNSGRLDREVQQICMQRRQAAIERELRLQKSLSEECEDLGVDEPSTSDLFPEALLFDSNNSPSFDQTSQDLLKRPIQAQEKEENKLTLFSDDDFMFEQYQTSDNQLCYEEVVDERILTNGQGNVETVCEDNTLLQTCTSMSDVTLSSPISPDTYSTNTPPPLNKYMHKYTNKKKNDRLKQVEHWTAEVSSSEDTTGSSEMIKSAGSPDICLNKRSDEDTDGSFKVVRLSLAKPTCDEMHSADSNECPLSGRGARKSVKKKCPCCNGAEDSAVSRKRPSSQPHASIPHKKAFPNKKR